MKKFSLRTKLSLSFASVVLISVLLVSAITNVLLDKHFKDYIIENQERKSREIVSQVSKMYKIGSVEDAGEGADASPEGTWDLEAIGNICISALEQGMIIKVVDTTGKTIWDARLHDNEKCEQMLTHMKNNMSSRYPNWEGGYAENTYPIKKGLLEVGEIIIGYYGPYYFNDSDLDFINTINKLLMAVGLFSLALSFLVGSVMAKRLSTPILRVITTARMISKGYFDGRVNEISSTKEIAQLTETINNLAQTLQNQEELRKRLTADVAHELRTPLATLQSHMEAMIDGIWEPSQERLKSCHEEIMRINRLVGSIEKLSKYENESLILTRTNFDICELIRHLIQNFEKDFSNKKITVEFHGDKEMITADRDKISQVIVNLLSNALKYTDEGGRVEVAAEGAADFIRIIIRDTGAGIAKEDLPYIFERFYRADKSRNRLTGGAGIGLTITKAIVDAHKGTIKVNSKVGEGTEFVVELPKG